MVSCHRKCEGVVLSGDYSFGDLYNLSTLNGRAVEFGVGTRIGLNGDPETLLFSGGYINGKPAIKFPTDAYPLAHVHPIADEFQALPSTQDLQVMQARVTDYLNLNPGAPIPAHYVIYSSGGETTAFSPLPIGYFGSGGH